MAFIGADFRRTFIISKIESSDQLIWISDQRKATLPIAAMVEPRQQRRGYAPAFEALREN
jgi:hypothetical protein